MIIAAAESAFLQTPMVEEVYMWPPSEAGEPPGTCWRMLKIIPGLRGGPRGWGEYASGILSKHGFDRNKADECVYTHMQHNVHTLRHMDDFVTTGPSRHLHSDVSQLTTALHLGERTSLAKPGDIARVTGTVVRRLVGAFEVETKEELADDIINDEFGETEHLPRAVQMPSEKERTTMTGSYDEPVSPKKHRYYRKQCGRLLCFDQHRADLQFITRKLEKAVQAPTTRDMKRLKRVIRYLRGTRNVVLTLRPTGRGLRPEGWSDSDWAGDVSRRSTSGGVLMLNGAPVLTFSRQQPTYALSSCEAELNAGTSMGCELLYVVEILRQMGFKVAKPLLHSDSSSALKVAFRNGGGGRLRHLELKQLVLQHWVALHRLGLVKCLGTSSPADFLTKTTTLDAFRVGLRLCCLGPRST